MRHAGRTLSLVGLVGLVAAGVAACGGGGGDECPYGYVRVDGECRPALVSDTGPSDVPGPPRDAGRDAAADLAADAPATDLPPDAPGDVPALDVPLPPDVPAPTGAVGDPCRRDRDCQEGLVCLGWQGGYCSKISCDQPESPCPSGAVCLRVDASASACFRPCATSADCRIAGGYACKPLPDGAGAAARVCHEVYGGAGAIGARCERHADCADVLLCVTGLPGGACLPLWCTNDADCAAVGALGGACVRFDGYPTCLARCTGAADCAGIGDGTLTCGTRRNLGGTSLQVCVSGVADLPLGAACLSGGECASGVCETLGDGRCTQGELPCSRPDQCPPASLCLPVSPAVTACAGTCDAATQNCRLLDGGACALRDDGAESCRPSCRWDAAHATHTCRAGTGWDCVWGVPLKDESREGYYCHARGEGAIGAPCLRDADCSALLPLCLVASGAPAGTTGYCSRACTPGTCPFGTHCMDVGGRLRCQRVCNSARDCAAGHACLPGASHDTCGPP
jgi:hypothetical protein